MNAGRPTQGTGEGGPPLSEIGFSYADITNETLSLQLPSKNALSGLSNVILDKPQIKSGLRANKEPEQKEDSCKYSASYIGPDFSPTSDS